MKTYIVDANVLITLFLNLPMSVYKSTWNSLKDYITKGRVVICKAVFNEIKNPEELKEWILQFKGLVIDCYTEEVIVEAKTIINSYPKLIDINNMGDEADPYLIALAKIKGYCVLTNEKYMVGAKKTRIPYVCKELAIDCVNPEDFYKEEAWEF